MAVRPSAKQKSQLQVEGEITPSQQQDNKAEDVVQGGLTGVVVGMWGGGALLGASIFSMKEEFGPSAESEEGQENCKNLMKVEKVSIMWWLWFSQ